MRAGGRWIALPTRADLPWRLRPIAIRFWAWIPRRTRCDRRSATKRLNGFTNLEWKEANCFDFLKAADQEKQRFDTVVIDPPAFARQKTNRESALRGYKELNLRAMKILNPGGYLVTCSCSFHVSEADLLEVIARRRAGCPPHRRRRRTPHAVARPSHSAHRSRNALLEVSDPAGAVKPRYFLAIDFFAMSNAENEHDQPSIFDLADEPVIAHPVFPKLPQARPTQRFSDAARIVQLCYSFVKEPQDALGVLHVELAQRPVNLGRQFNVPGHGVS